MKCKQVFAWGTGRILLINAIKSDQALMIKKQEPGLVAGFSF